MNDTPTPAVPPVDTSKIKIAIKPIEEPDFRFDIEVPSELVNDISSRLKSGGLDYGAKKMNELLVTICLDEAMVRFDKESAFGPKPIPTEDTSMFKEDSPFKFSAIVDEAPLLQCKKVDSIPIIRHQIDVNDVLVSSELYEQQLFFGTREKYSGPLAFGDEITCTATLTIRGNKEPEFSLPECKVRVPKNEQPLIVGTISSIEASSALLCLKEGENSISVPIDINSAQAILELKEITAERITPCPIDEVLKQYGTPNETILRAQIKLSLQRNFNRENETIMRNQLFEFLNDHLDIPVSSHLVNYYFQDLCKKGVANKDDGAGLSDEEKSDFQANSESIAKRRTISACYQIIFNLNVNEEDIQLQICDIAESKRVRPEDITIEFENSDRMHVLGNMALEKKIFDNLQDKMIFTDAT